MTTIGLGLAALFGLVIGSFLNVVAYRVPSGISLTRPSQCPKCEVAIRWYHNVPVLSWLWLRGKCAECRQPIPARYPIVEGLTGVLFAVAAWFGWQVHPQPNLAASLTLILALWWLVGISVVLTLIDLDTHRLPDAIVLPSYLVAAVLLTLTAVLGGGWSDLLRAGIGMVALGGFYAVLWLIRPDGMGAGDVKLAGVLGAYLGWFGWAPLLVGALAAFLLGGIFGLALIAWGRAGRRTAIPFGPWLLAGAWTGLLAGAPMAASYLGWYR